MNITGNTIFITGGGTGIGRGLAEALHQLGNKVIISGRRVEKLADVVAANPGIEAIELDVSDPASIASVTSNLVARHPDLNVIVNNAGIMVPDDAAGTIDADVLMSTVNTNLLGPIRLTSALINHLRAMKNASIVYTSSVLAFTPLAFTATYSATKAAIHSYAMSQRFQLKDTNVEVIEIAPPWVRTELMNSQEVEIALPLEKFIAQVIELLKKGDTEIIVDAAKLQRAVPGPDEYTTVTRFNEDIFAFLANS